MFSQTLTPKLSIVLIGRNEEQFISKSIESALSCRKLFPDTEIVFVDSASTDRSIEIAMNYPIRIIQLRPEWRLCVAAGRYLGFLHSHGEYVLFCDGDAQLEPNWVDQAIQFMDTNAEYGGVAGVLDEEYVDRYGTRHGGATNVFGQNLLSVRQDCKLLGGIAMYRLKAMQLAGPVNPHLPTAEDHELCMRIRNQGFKLARIQGRMAVKYTEKRDTLYEVIRRSRTKMFDYGAVIRYCALYGRGLQFCFDAIPYIVSYAATCCLLLLALPIAAYLGYGLYVAAFAALLFAAVVAKKRSLRLAILSIVVRSVSTYRTITSFVSTKTKAIDAYPTNVVHIR
jgi:glycosyltransferase involved in cell wall biosynthesis